MTVSNQPSSLLDSVLNAETNQQNVGVTVLKKAQDQVKQQGQAMVKLLEQAGVSAEGSKLYTYAFPPPTIGPQAPPICLWYCSGPSKALISAGLKSLTL